MKTVLESGLFCCTKQVLNCLQEMGDYWWPAMESASSIMSLPQSWFVMLRLGPPKKKEESVKTVLKTGLFYCTEQILNCVQEMGDWQLTCNESASPIKSLPQYWFGMLTLSPPKKTKRSVWKLFWNLDCSAVLNRSWTVYKRWVTIGDLQWSLLHP